MTRKQEILFHLSVWIYWFALVGYYYDAYYYAMQPNKWLYLLHYSLTKGFSVGFFYIHYLWVVPMLIVKRKAWKYIIITIVLSYLNYNLHSVVWNNLNLDFFFTYKEDQKWSLFHNDSWLTILALGLYLLKKWVGSEAIKNNLLEEVKKTELQFLKSQMSPHFLFNTLNNIYGLSIKGDHKTPEAISQLESIMDYVELMEKNVKIKIHTEINFLEDYIALNKLRYKTKIDFEVEVDLKKEFVIEPMLLLPLIENAFKHGKNGVDGFLKINLIIKESELSFRVENNFDANKRKDEVSGVGLKNISRRLELIYPKVSQFDQLKTKDVFTSFLTLEFS